MFGGGAMHGAPAGPAEEAEYPNPGSVASCDACGQVVRRYYHCADCIEETGLFDLCVRCCGVIYLESHGRPMKLDHPTHDYATHRMLHIFPLEPSDGAARMGAGGGR